MKKVVLRKWAETVLTWLTVINFMLVASINDFNLAASPVVFGLMLVAVAGAEILNKYGR